MVEYLTAGSYCTLVIKLDIELVAVGTVRPRERVVAEFIQSGAVALDLFDPHRIEGVTLDLADILIESQLKLRFCLAGVIDKRRAAVSENGDLLAVKGLGDHKLGKRICRARIAVDTIGIIIEQLEIEVAQFNGIEQIADRAVLVNSVRLSVYLCIRDSTEVIRAVFIDIRFNHRDNLSEFRFYRYIALGHNERFIIGLYHPCVIVGSNREGFRKISVVRSKRYLYFVAGFCFRVAYGYCACGIILNMYIEDDSCRPLNGVGLAVELARRRSDSVISFVPVCDLCAYCLFITAPGVNAFEGSRGVFILV